MVIRVVNAQRRWPVRVPSLRRLAERAVRRLKIRTPGTLAITFIGAQRMRVLNRRFLRHDHVTDVLSFRYDGEPVVGEVLIAPRAARAYARAHRVSYDTELARYVIHGLLHWLGHQDRTAAQQRKMRTLEDHLLSQCGLRAVAPNPQPPTPSRA